RLSVCPSVRLYPPSKTSSNCPILKILFLLERYCIRDPTFILFVRLSVRFSVRPSISLLTVCFNCRSNRPILKILFLLERYSIRDLSFILFVRPSVRVSVRL